MLTIRKKRIKKDIEHHHHRLDDVNDDDDNGGRSFALLVPAIIKSTDNGYSSGDNLSSSSSIPESLLPAEYLNMMKSINFYYISLKRTILSNRSRGTYSRKNKNKTYSSMRAFLSSDYFVVCTLYKNLVTEQRINQYSYYFYYNT